MKNKNNKGFLLVETLIVTVFAASTMIFIFVQFRRITNNYDTSFKYNTVEAIYATNQINNYILNNGYERIFEYMLETNDNGDYVNRLPYVILYDGNSCSNVYLDEIDYCNRLMSLLNVKQVVVTYADLDFKDAKDSISFEDVFSNDFKKFVKSIKYDTGDQEISKRRTIVAFKNGTFASLKLYRRG